MKFSKDLKIAITGGAGYIGSFTTKYLKSKGFDNLVILDNFSKGYKKMCFSRYWEVDLLDKKKLNEIFKKERFEAVFHFASLIVVPESMEDPYWYFYHNLQTALNLLQVMKENKVSYIVFSSSCAIYGTPEKLPIKEDGKIAPESVYAETKWMIEKMIGWYSKLFGMKYAFLRYFNAAGATDDGSFGELHRPETHLIPKAIARILQGKPIEIYGKDYDTRDGTTIRDYIHVLDLASVHYLALKYIMENEKSDTFNLGVGKEYSTLEVVKTILTEAKKYHLAGTFEFRRRRAGDVPILYADSRKARKVLGWEPKYQEIEKIVETAFRWQLRKQTDDKKK